jgi:hypothetical protein
MPDSTNRLPRSVFLMVAFVAATLLSVFLWSKHGSTAPASGITLDKFIELTESGKLHPSINTRQITNQCPPYIDSTVRVAREQRMTIGPNDNWIAAIEHATPHTEILLRDGRYVLDRHAVVVRDHITIRSVSGRKEQVIITGTGYSTPGEGLMIVGKDVIVADLSIAEMRDHAVSIKPEQGAISSIRLYNIHLYDIGTQHIKLNVGGSTGGLVACSTIGYTAGAAVGDYNGAIDLHQASNWTVRDNLIYNIRGDGSGCNVDRDCGRYYSGPAILVWNQSNDNRIIRNRIFDSYRNIALGLGRGHTNGMVADNIILQAKPGDAGIELQTATNTVVENNIVILAGSYPGAIEYRDSSDIIIRDNQITSNPHNRGQSRNVHLQRNSINPQLYKSLAEPQSKP